MGKGLILTIIVVLLIAGGVFTYYKLSSPITNPADEDPCYGWAEANLESKDACYYTEAVIISNDSSNCDKIEGTQWADSCYSELAVNLQQDSLCTKVKESARISDCYQRLAEKTRNSAYCSYIPTISSKDNCYIVIATMLKDKVVCDYIENSVMKDNCIKSI